MNNRYVIPYTFLRTKDPRPEYAEHIIQYKEQVKLRDKYSVPFTCLMTYDALRDSEMSSLVKGSMDKKTDIGIWLELCREVVEKAGIKWRGKQEWEWTVEPGFLMAYSEHEKERIIDLIMEEYHSLFGHFPKTIAAWLIDSYSMQYISEKYNPSAFVICREQWAMDAYTLWGGPYYGGYYPSKNNMLCPAQTQKEQINTPVFRAYVNDQIYCYYEHERTKYNKIDYNLFTQEPVWMCGQNPEWVKWHYDSMFLNDNRGFLYTQIGQENSFQWTAELEKALKYQYEFAHANKDKYGFEYITFAEMGEKFKETYDHTPSTCVYALKDWANNGNKSVWYNNNRYRINVFSDSDRVWLRDLQLFDENYRDVYLDEPCNEKMGVYDNLPIIDGVQFSDEGTQGGMFFGKGSIESVDRGIDGVVINVVAEGNNIKIKLSDNEICFECECEFNISFKYKEKCAFIENINEKEIVFHNKTGVMYRVLIECGLIKNNVIYSQKGNIIFKL